MSLNTQKDLAGVWVTELPYASLKLSLGENCVSGYAEGLSGGLGH